MRRSASVSDNELEYNSYIQPFLWMILQQKQYVLIHLCIISVLIPDD